MLSEMKNDAQKMFVSDMDGTLLQSDGMLSDYSRKTLTERLEAGVHFTVASARAWGDISFRCCPAGS